MQLHQNNFYHIYNRSNNNEAVFRTHDNYVYFLQKYRAMLSGDIETLCYCLMPTHFHFLVRVTSEHVKAIGSTFGILLSSYTQGFNKVFGRHGSLFQQHTRAKHIDNEGYLITLVSYIHQNPVRAKLTEKPEEWLYSSYQDYIGMRNGTLPAKAIAMANFATASDFRAFSEQSIKAVEPKYWV